MAVDNVTVDVSTTSSTGQRWLNDVVWSDGDQRVIFLFTPNANLSTQTPQEHHVVHGESCWYMYDGKNGGDAAIVLSNRDMPSAASILNGSIVQLDDIGKIFWFASVQTLSDTTGNNVAFFVSDSLTQRPTYKQIVLNAAGRDPRVILDKSNNSLLMAYSCLNGISFYRNADRNGYAWQLESTFPIPNYNIIECPQLLLGVQVFDGLSQSPDILFFSGNYNTANTSSGCYISYGEYKGTQGGWVEKRRERVDLGTDFYAAYFAPPALYSWLGNWNYSTNVLFPFDKMGGAIVRAELITGKDGSVAASTLYASPHYPNSMILENWQPDGKYLGVDYICSPCQIVLNGGQMFRDGDGISLGTGTAYPFSVICENGQLVVTRGDDQPAPSYNTETQYDWLKKSLLNVDLQANYYTLAIRLTDNSANITYIAADSTVVSSAQLLLTAASQYRIVKLVNTSGTSYAQNSFNVYYARPHMDAISRTGVSADDVAGVYVPQKVADQRYLSSAIVPVRTYDNEYQSSVYQITVDKMSNELVATQQNEPNEHRYVPTSYVNDKFTQTFSSQYEDAIYQITLDSTSLDLIARPKKGGDPVHFANVNTNAETYLTQMEGDARYVNVSVQPIRTFANTYENAVYQITIDKSTNYLVARNVDAPANDLGLRYITADTADSRYLSSNIQPVRTFSNNYENDVYQITVDATTNDLIVRPGNGAAPIRYKPDIGS